MKNEKIVKTIVFILCFICFYSASAQNTNTKKTDLEKECLTKNVKSVKTKVFEAINESGEMANSMIYVTKYNSNGYISERLDYDYKDSITRTIYKYDEKGHLIKPINNDNETYKYDTVGNLIEKFGYNSSNNLIYKITYKYNEKGNLIELDSFFPYTNSYNKLTYTYQYNAKGEWIKQIELDNSDNVTTMITEREIEYY